MEQVKNKDVQDERGFYEMPLVNYSYENLNYDSKDYTNNRNDFSNNHGMHDQSQIEDINEIDVSREGAYRLAHHEESDLKNNLQEANRQKLSYVWVEAFLCAIILLGILIIQNVKNTEGLQLTLRQEIRHNLTAQEITAVGENLEDMMQKHKNVRP